MEGAALNENSAAVLFESVAYKSRGSDKYSKGGRKS